MTPLSCRIYDHHLELVQVSRGHEDSIRDIVHIPELDQVSQVMYIVSCSYSSGVYDGSLGSALFMILIERVLICLVAP